LEPLESLLEEKEIYGLLLIDRRECTVGILRGKTIQKVFYDTSMVPGKHGRGGQSQRRFERLTEEAAKSWLKQCGEKASEIFRQEKGLVGILVGGPGPTKRDFVASSFLHHELENKIIDTFDTGYTDEYGLGELVENASQAIAQVALIKEKRLFERFQKEVMKTNQGLATYGEEQVRWALQMGAVDILLLSEGLRRYRVLIACPNCGHEVGTKTVDRDKVEAAAEGKCPKCQSYFGVTEQTDLIDELSDLAEETGAKVELVSTESEEGSTMMRAFGGITAILRYPLPERKDTT
jgi:peptide chain release factor subunit 1